MKKCGWERSVIGKSPKVGILETERLTWQHVGEMFGRDNILKGTDGSGIYMCFGRRQLEVVVRRQLNKVPSIGIFTARYIRKPTTPRIYPGASEKTSAKGSMERRIPMTLGAP